MDHMLSELKAFGRALPKDEQERLAKVLSLPLKRIGAVSYAGSIHSWAILLLCIILEQERRIAGLEDVADGRIQEKGQGRLMDKDA